MIVKCGRISVLLLLLCFSRGALAGTTVTAPPAGDFIAGADVSHCAYFESLGAHYLDHGRRADIFSILKSHRVNLVRLRLFTSSDEQAMQSPYDSINNMNYTLPLAVRATRAGMRWLLDFHYSDYWADSNHQTKPKAWQGLTFFQLEKRMYEYNRNCIETFRKAGAMPAYVQIGNEISSGLVWPDAETDTPGHWKRLGRLLKAAIQGVRDGAGAQQPKIVIHISSGDQWDVIKAFFDHLHDQGVDYDMIGLSYFPDPTSKIEDLQTALTNTVARFNRPVVIVETAFPWAQSTAEGDIAEPILDIMPGREGQAKYVQTLCRTMLSLPDGMGAGIVWWGAEYETIGQLDLNGYDCSSLFDYAGNALPAMDALGQFGASGPATRQDK